MLDHEKEAKERQKKREAEYDEMMAQARIERAIARYERLSFGCREHKVVES